MGLTAGRFCETLVGQRKPLRGGDPADDTPRRRTVNTYVLETMRLDLADDGHPDPWSLTMSELHELWGEYTVSAQATDDEPTS